MATFQGTNTTKVESSLLKRTVNTRDKIFENKNKSPLLNTLYAKGRTVEETQQTFEWLETQQTSLKFKVNAVDDNATSLTVSEGTVSILKAGDLLKNIVTQEQIYIKDVLGSTLTVERGYDDNTTKASISASHTLLMTSIPFEEGSSAPEGTYLTRGEGKNYLQIFRKTVDITRNKAKTGMYGETSDGRASDRRKTERNKILKLLQNDIERQLMFGSPKKDITGTKPKYTTGGLLHFIKSNIIDIKSAGDFKIGTISELMGIMADNGADGDKILYAGSDFIAKLNDNVIKTFGGGAGSTVKQYGTIVNTIATEYGDLEVMYNPVLSDIYSNMAVIVDIDTLMLHIGEDITLETNIHEPGYDGYKDGFLAELGLEVNNEACNGIIRLNF